MSGGVRGEAPRCSSPTVQGLRGGVGDVKKGDGVASFGAEGGVVGGAERREGSSGAELRKTGEIPAGA